LSQSDAAVGIVVIGRNEAPNLASCLRSVAGYPLVYVDSGSSDASVPIAREHGAFVVDLTAPFSAARARNAGFRQLRLLDPGLEYVQFVDGDCKVLPGWIGCACDFLAEHAAAAVACGRLKERHVERSVYNLLCDMEWDRPAGPSLACGGNAMMRVSDLEAVGGFRDQLLAGEEPELCVRLRERGREIWRLDADMALHDANIEKFSQWWLRAARGGYGFAEISTLHRGSPCCIWAVETRRAIVWAGFLPAAIIAASFLTPWALSVFLIYPLQVLRLARRRGPWTRRAWVYGLFMTIGKFAELQGIVHYSASRPSMARVLPWESESNPLARTAIIIVNYRTAGLVINCLRSLLPEIGPDDRVVIVDNASGDDSVGRIGSWLAESDPSRRASVLSASANGGFAVGNNLGIRKIHARYYLLLNSDTLVRPGLLAALVAAADGDARTGLFGPRLEGADGDIQVSCFRKPTPFSEIIDAARSGPVTRILSRYEVPVHAADAGTKPDWISYACVLMRREALERAGLLDEGFFMYYEDVEHCHRVRRAGFGTRYVPVARVVHLHGGSSDVPQMTRLRKRLPPYFYRSRARYFWLVYGRTGLFMANLCWTLGRVISLLRELFGRESHVPVHKWLDIWNIGHSVFRR
jgi:GT2 family glycosyltransferase